MRLLPILLACILPLTAEASPDLPASLLKSIKADPTTYLDTVAGLIAAYGGEGGITADEVDGSVALMRAKARTRTITRLLAADLDGDGAVTRDEVNVTKAAASANGRARLERAFVAGDTDGDSVVSVEELAEAGAQAAVAALSPARMAQVKVLMGFDIDGDGKVSLAEVQSGLAELTLTASAKVEAPGTVQHTWTQGAEKVQDTFVPVKG